MNAASGSANIRSDSNQSHAADTIDGRKKLADSIPRAIEAGFIILGDGRRLELATKVRFSNLNTRYYPPDDDTSSRWASNVPVTVSPDTKTEISIIELPALDGTRFLYDSLSGSTASHGKIAVLSYATAGCPGGGFLDGGEAQEESIARSSTLYPSLMTDTAQQFYQLHNRDPRGGFHYHAMIYTPSVVVFRNWAGEIVTLFEVDVLTCAAVDAGEVQKNAIKDTDQAELEKVIASTMRERMGRILSVMEQQGVKNIVLGSFGCGVYRNNVEMVAGIWAELLTMPGARFRSSFDRVVFSILGAGTFMTSKQTFEKLRNLMEVAIDNRYGAGGR